MPAQTYSTKEAAQALGVSTRTIYRLAAAGRLTPLRRETGGPLLFERDAFWQAMRQRPRVRL